MKNPVPSLLKVIALAGLTSSAIAQDHGHLNVGAVGTNQNDQLIFDNSAIFETGSGYVKTLTYATNGPYAGYYQGSITLTALAATTNHLGPVPKAPALGSWIFAQLVSVDGPSDGAFAFWDAGATSPTISLASGRTGTNTWQLSENDGAPDTDPYGHIHGRRFTATKPGVYTVGFRAYDFSTSGVGGGPIHTPSTVVKLYFQAGDNVHSIEPDVDHTHVRIGARVGYTWQLEAATKFSPPDWQIVGELVIGDDYFHEILDDNRVEGNRYYRVKGTAIVP
jgi:hypothetical protein